MVRNDADNYGLANTILAMALEDDDVGAFEP
jgi:hypothetical protein